MLCNRLAYLKWLIIKSIISTSILSHSKATFSPIQTVSIDILSTDDRIYFVILLNYFLFSTMYSQYLVKYYLERSIS